MKYTLIISIAVIVLVSGLMFTSCAGVQKKKNGRGLYKNETGREKAFRSYDRAMELWEVPFREEQVTTGYGTTHVVVAGPPDARPLVLIPGLFADATMWYANAGELSGRYRIIAPDHLLFGGKSRPGEKKIETEEDLASWYRQILDHFGYESAAVAGLSYGSWAALAIAREQQDSVDAVVMLDPSETFIPMDGGIAWRGFLTFAVFPNREKYSRFFDWLGGGYSDERLDVWFDHMLNVIEYGSVGMFDIPRHRIYTAEELNMIAMPVLVAAGGKPILYKDIDQFKAAAAGALPHARIEVVEGTGHSLNMEKPAVVNGLILDFLEKHYR